MVRQQDAIAVQDWSISRMPEYTTTEAAALLGVNRRNVQNYCKRHGLEKFGREYVVTEVDLEGMRTELGKVGRKPGTTKGSIDSRIDSQAPTPD